MSRADDLFQRLLAGYDGSDSGEVSNDFLSELYNGYPIESVQALLESDRQRVVDYGIFLLDELGRRAASLRAAAIKLAREPVGYRRYVFLAFCINTKLADDEIIAAIGRLLDDPDLRVRVRTMLWIANAKMDVLRLLWQFLYPNETFSLEDITGEWPKERYLQRAQRAFRIGASIKLEQDVVDIQENMHHEDNYTFEMLRELYVVIEPAMPSRDSVDSRAYWKRQRKDVDKASS